MLGQALKQCVCTVCILYNGGCVKFAHVYCNTGHNMQLKELKAIANIAASLVTASNKFNTNVFILAVFLSKCACDIHSKLLL